MKNRIFTMAFFVMAVIQTGAQNIPDPMYPPRLVNDFANLFSRTENQALEEKLLAYNDTTSTQIYVVTVTDLEGYPVSEYSFALGNKWQIGRAGKDNGLVILIKPRVGNSRGQAFIATGYGLESTLTDAFTGRVIRERMVPSFQEDDYFGGVNAAVDAVIERLSGEFDADEEGEGGAPFWVSVLVLFIVFVVVAILFGRGDQHIGGGGHQRGGGSVFFPPVSRGGSSGWGGGGFGGGGFGGGGGGRFGGGGAGGSW